MFLSPHMIYVKSLKQGCLSQFDCLLYYEIAAQLILVFLNALSLFHNKLYSIF